MRWWAMGWAAMATGAAAALSSGIVDLPFALPDAAHIAGHLLLFGGLAALLGRTLSPGRALLLTLAAGAAVEVAQALASGHLSPREVLFDGVVDALSAMAGLAVGRRRAVAEALGAWLHPALVFPVGLAGTCYAAERDLGAAALWALIGCAGLAPAALGWWLGVRRGWFSDVDLVDRTERPPLFLAATAAAAASALAVRFVGAPSAITAVADGTAWGAAALTALTVAGFKVSGHVAVSVLLAVAIAPWSGRGPLLFLASAVLLSWARVAAGKHRPAEVAGAWALGAAAWVVI